MSKIDELIESKVDPHVFKINGYEALSDVMKEYAEYYARKVLKFVEDECTPDWVHPDNPDEESYIGFEPGELLNIQLPEHE
jgi:hypothetical protein